MNNIEYFNFSLKHNELLFDRNYFVDEIIVGDLESELMKSNKKLQDTIHKYADRKEDFFSDGKNIPENEKEEYIDLIIELLSKDNMNLTNFAQSFSAFDSSFSVFSDMTKIEKKNFLSFVLDQYVETRMQLYKELNDNYIQILYDSHSHKRMGSLGAKKISSELNNNGYKYIDHVEILNNEYFLPDNIKKNKFIEFLKINKIDCLWSSEKQNKMPDAVFKYNDIIYIVEHKHLKESGGGQDKQITEIVDLIKKSQDGISYISYLDGPYFNNLINPSPTKKIYKIKQDIISNLSLNLKNYFLNTAGFKQFIKDLKKSI